MRTLGIDFGTKRIGLAISDAGGKYAAPLEVITYTAVAEATATIIALVRREKVQQIVVGLPLNMDDSMSPMAAKAVEFGRALSAAVGVAVVFVDERLSSFGAEQQMIDLKRAGAKLTRGMKKQQLDARAAANFLQSYLDGQLQPIQV
jgi:putative Holliday junction resolvase